MVEITLRELHLKTGQWVDRARQQEKIVITRAGRPVATLMPFQPADRGIRFGQRRVLKEFATLGPMGGDSTAGISEDRDRP